MLKINNQLRKLAALFLILTFTIQLISAVAITPTTTYASDTTPASATPDATPDVTPDVSPAEAELSISSYSLDLSANLGLNLYAQIPEADQMQNQAQTQAYIELEIEGHEPIKYRINNLNKTDNGYVIPCELAAAEMTKPITVFYVNSLGEKTQIFSCSIADYSSMIISLAQINSKYNVSAKLVKAMLNYGANAQAYFKYDESNPANAYLSNEDKFLQNLTEKDFDGIEKAITGTQQGIEYVGSSLILKDTTTIRHYFKTTGANEATDVTDMTGVNEATDATDMTGANDVSKFIDIASIPVTIDNQPATLTQAGTYCYIEKTNLLPTDLTDYHEVKVGDMTIKYSAMCYIKDALFSQEVSDDLKNLLKSLFAYSKEAKSYSESCYKYKQTDESFTNPLIGFAPCADYIDAVGDNTLVYVDITWRELEPEEGAFAFDAIEKSNYLDRWRAAGKNVVLRFLCDKPGSKEHMDIPDWLYEKTQDGTFYDNSYGKGYSPNYENEFLIEKHSRAISALGEKFGQDYFVSYIELGSVGHWGEWHVNYDEGVERLPGWEILRQYVTPYLAAFPNAKLCMRRPFEAVSEYGLGIYNDMAGHKSETKRWLSWIQSGTVYESLKIPAQLPACPNIWNQAPVGGELTSSYSVKSLLTDRKEQTIELLDESHMSFIGPNCPIACDEEQKYPEAIGEFRKHIGYRYGVTEAVIEGMSQGNGESVSMNNTEKNTITVIATLRNFGVAPMYFDWPVCIYLLDEAGEVVRRVQTDTKLSTIPGGSQTDVSARISLNDVTSMNDINGISAGHHIAIGIENPDTQAPQVKLDMNSQNINNMYLLN